MPVNRESAIKPKKAPAVDPVAALASAPVDTPQGVEVSAKPSEISVLTGSEGNQSSPVRRGPGRPSKKRRMEPLSTNIAIELRDAVDAFTQEHEMTLIDFLDLAFREKLERDK